MNSNESLLTVVTLFLRQLKKSIIYSFCETLALINNETDRFVSAVLLSVRYNSYTAFSKTKLALLHEIKQ